jgi:SAM-dependent methyltransferase
MNDKVTDSIRENYDRLAEEYARRLFNELQHKPLDRELLSRVVNAVKGRGDVCDLGCGPGHVARYLRDAGISVFGLDLSAGMLDQARRLNPDIPFREGNMLALDFADATLAGIVAFYSIVNIPRESVSLAFQEMERVLKPSGQLLLAFHMGEGVTGENELWGHKITINFFFFEPLEIQRYLETAGFAVEEIIEREPYPELEYPSRRAYIFARKSASARPNSEHPAT